jgi:hypothetical protein
MTTFATELVQNQEAYARLREQIRGMHAGRYVAIARGALVAVADSFDEAAAAVDRLRPPAEHFLVFPADDDPVFDVIDDFSETP